jgi:DNA (cytosine-5)-methyltransferase 1
MHQPKPRALDLFCCGGGASIGLTQAGFDVTGVDIEPQKGYPFSFIQADALEFPLEGYDFIWASPPCQAYSACKDLNPTKHPDLVDLIRQRLLSSNTLWVIENVEGAPLINPTLLCGTMFGIPTYRHRLFESNFLLPQPDHPTHTARVTKMGRPPQPGEFLNPVGHFSGVPLARQFMGMPHASQYQLAQAVPTCYSKWIGEQALAVLQK